MAAARTLRPPSTAASIEALIGLMASTGLRLGEALGLDRQHVDLDDGALHVRVAKQSKQREVPLHPTTTAALRVYARTRDRYRPEPQRDREDVDVLGSQEHRVGVTEHMRRDTFAPERRAGGVGGGDVHESTKSTEIYLHADNKLKQQAIERTPTGTPPGRYQPPDTLLAFLERL